MYRTLTAAVALAAGLGVAGLAQAQMNAPSSHPMTSPSGTSGGTAQPQTNENQNLQQASVSQSQVQQAQQQLKAQGLYRGAVDGKDGPRTQQAVMAFQREHGLPETAQLDQQTLIRLSGGQQQQPGGAQSMTPSTPAGPQNPATQNQDNGTTPGGSGMTPSGASKR